MKKILAIGAAAAALIGVSSVASAQEDCLNGWRMIKEQVPVRCDVLPSAFGPRESPVEQFVTGAITAPVNAITAPVNAITAPVEEPLYTGSIAPAPVEESEMPPRPGAPESFTFAASRDECQPGQYWMMELSSGNRPVACE